MKIGSGKIDKGDDFIPREEKGAKISIDLFETEGEMIIQSTVAGISSKDLKVSIEDGVLTIKGMREKPSDFAESQKRYLYQECYWGPFYRSLLMPEEIDADGIKASVEEGVLTVRIPKTDKRGKREIEIA